MKVILQRNWYTGEGLIKANGNQPVEVPSKFRDQLPSTAIEVDEDGNEVKRKVSKEDAAAEKAAAKELDADEKAQAAADKKAKAKAAAAAKKKAAAAAKKAAKK